MSHLHASLYHLSSSICVNGFSAAISISQLPEKSKIVLSLERCIIKHLFRLGSYAIHNQHSWPWSIRSSSVSLANISLIRRLSAADIRTRRHNKNNISKPISIWLHGFS
jgi:hypothetical protein